MKAFRFLPLFSLLLLAGCSLFDGAAVSDCRSDCRRQGYADGACRPLSLEAPEGLEPGSACRVDESQACDRPGLCRCYCLPQESTPPGGEALSVAEALQRPQDEEVTVYGVVYQLGERYCPCFRLSSGGADVEAWFAAAVESGSRPVDMEGIHNGDRVIVSGIRTSPATLHMRRIWKDGDD